MLPILTPLFEVLACLGFGALILKPLGFARWLRADEIITWSFGLGFGVLGWLTFLFGWAGFFGKLQLVILILSGLPFVILLRQETVSVWRKFCNWTPNLVEKLCLAGIVLVFAFDVIEAIPPPSDADTLAYHFALPKTYLAQERLEFVPRAIDGAVPLLVNMTYVPALALGGERGLTLWTMISGWFAGALFLSLCLRYLTPKWSISTVLIFFTTPAVIYSSGSGHVEVRLTLFAIIGAFSVAQAIKTGDWRFALIAGLAAGFFMGGKYTGLLFAAAAGAVILFQRRWLNHGLAMALGGAIAGCQWYLWNWVHTGDPVFPVLYNYLKDIIDYRYWDQAHADSLRDLYFAHETPLERTLLGLISYPFIATLAGLPQFESGRTGFGPLVLLLLPFVTMSIWINRKKILTHEIFPLATILLIFYVTWFLSGSSQKVRHMLPVYPLLLVCFAIASERLVHINLRGPITSVFAATLGLQIIIVMLFSVNSAKYVFCRESNKSYLTRTVSGFSPVPWINNNLSMDDKVFTQHRQFLYHLNVPYFFAHTIDQVQINLLDSEKSPKRFVHQAKKLGVTHLLLPGSLDNVPDIYTALTKFGCLKEIKRFAEDRFGSRTLRNFKEPIKAVSVLHELTLESCAF